MTDNIWALSWNFSAGFSLDTCHFTSNLPSVCVLLSNMADGGGLSVVMFLSFFFSLSNFFKDLDFDLNLLKSHGVEE